MFTEHQIQTNDSYCVSYCLYVIYRTKVLGINLKSAVLNSYYQSISWIWMTFTKTTVDNSVKYIVKTNHSIFSSDRDRRKKNVSSNILSQKNKKPIKHNSAEGFRVITGITICYF